MSFNYVSLAFDLPEDLMRAKMSGRFDLLNDLIDARLSDKRTSPIMKERLYTEKLTLSRWLKRFIYDRSGAVALCKRRIRDFEEKELDAFEKMGMVDYIFYNGEKRYLSSFCSTLIKTFPEIGARSLDKKEEVDDGTAFKPFFEEISEKGCVGYEFTVKSSLRIEDGAFKPGAYLAHIPVPAVSAQQREKDIKIVCDADAVVSSPAAAQRAVCFKRHLDENRPFEVEFSYSSVINYVRPLEEKPHLAYPDVPAPTREDLSEQYPNIVFTPYLKQLAKWIAGDETRPLYMAKRVYDYITLNVKYSFMRPYVLIDRQAEYCALNMKGDCGIQALLFITLCRILGIPARWQSGLTVDRFSTGDHDWAQFWTDGFGWLFADPSYGGGGARQEDEIKRNFFFGNLDPFRMVANRVYGADFEVPKRFMRSDPCDSQDGEIESENMGLDGSLFDKTDTTVKFNHM